MKFDSWEQNLASHTPEVQAAARALEDVIRREAPHAVVAYDAADGLLWFGTSMKMRDLLFALIPHASWVNLQLAHGALLANPEGLIEGTGKKIRHVKVRSAEMAHDSRIAAIIRAEIEALAAG